MKVSIGTNIKEGPWGGGNLFAKNLLQYLKQNKFKVTTDLKDNDIDIILITEPRKTSESSAFTHIDALNYLKYVNNDTLIVHRINECDERKNTNYVNKYLIEANKAADYTIFVSSWLKNLYIDQGIGTKENHVIYAGANPEIFNNTGFKGWSKNAKLKIVTHHWGANWNKGFNIYSKLDQLLSENIWKEKMEFMYIGNLPKGFKFKNTNVVNPLSGNALSDKIKENHLYITGSKFEPSGNHHIEGAQCGLPVLYVNSGGTPEYCRDFGLEISESDLEIKLTEMMMSYEEYVDKLKKYPFNSNKMCEEYLEAFKYLITNKEDIIKDRQLKSRSNYFEKFYFEFKRKKRNG